MRSNVIQPTLVLDGDNDIQGIRTDNNNANTNNNNYSNSNNYRNSNNNGAENVSANARISSSNINNQ